jgi:hypothetical protein
MASKLDFAHNNSWPILFASAKLSKAIRVFEHRHVTTIFEKRDVFVSVSEKLRIKMCKVELRAVYLCDSAIFTNGKAKMKVARLSSTIAGD